MAKPRRSDLVFLAGPLASEQYTGAALPPEDVQLDLVALGSDHYHAADVVLDLGGPGEDAQVEVGDRAQRHARSRGPLVGLRSSIRTYQKPTLQALPSEPAPICV